MKKLTKAIEAKIRKEIISRHSENWFDLGNNWFSTCPSNPMAGSIFQNIEKGEIISFVDKYKIEHVGILYEISYEKSNKTIYPSIICFEGNILDSKPDFADYLISRKHITDNTVKQIKFEN